LIDLVPKIHKIISPEILKTFVWFNQFHKLIVMILLCNKKFVIIHFISDFCWVTFLSFRDAFPFNITITLFWNTSCNWIMILSRWCDIFLHCFLSREWQRCFVTSTTHNWNLFLFCRKKINDKDQKQIIREFCWCLLILANK
jgi:hypothetical protein